jgi:BirA family biotin operon repressor/biotin-[acetyl-CoA-carboxylase] ligase
MANTYSDIEVIRFKEIDSTNNEARRRLDKETVLPYWIVSDKQTSGRGRHNSYWDSSEGNFMGTYILRIEGEKKILPQLSFVSALAIYNSILEFKPRTSNSSIKLKWPNDIVINDKKCGGILIENLSSEGNFFHKIAIGIGVNLITSPSHTTNLQSGNVGDEFGISLGRDDFLTAVNSNILKVISVWDKGKHYKQILNLWVSKAYLLGKEISVTLPGGVKEQGTFSSIDDEGGLILLNKKGSRKVFYAAEIFENL